MKITSAFLLLASAQAFTNQAFGVSRGQTSLALSASTGTGSASGRTTVRKSIDSLDKDNFSATLTEIEPFLLKDAGMTFYTKSIRRIGRSAKHLGVAMPENYAKDAKATTKRREKQNAFIQTKVEEAEAAAAEAAAAAAEAAEAAAEAPAEEEAAEPVEA